MPGLAEETDREARNRIARKCAELHQTVDELTARVALFAPIVDAAIDETACENEEDGFTFSALQARINLNNAREVRRNAVRDYLAGTR